MITILNRKELLCTFDMMRQAKVRKILENFHIEYQMKLAGRGDAFASNRGRMGTFGENLDLETEYIIYVKKEDYEKALFLVQRNSEG